MRQCTQCVLNRARASAVRLAGITTAILVAVTLSDLARRPLPWTEIVLREVAISLVNFAVAYFVARWALHQEHERRPLRERLLRIAAWGLVLLAVAGGVALIAARALRG
jgi:hypothetical protein